MLGTFIILGCLGVAFHYCYIKHSLYFPVSQTFQNLFLYGIIGLLFKSILLQMGGQVGKSTYVMAGVVECGRVRTMGEGGKITVTLVHTYYLNDTLTFMLYKCLTICFLVWPPCYMLYENVSKFDMMISDNSIQC